MKFLNQIIKGWKSFFSAIRYRFDDYEWWEWDRDFWEEINIGYYEQYIFPYERYDVPFISKERQLRLAQKPETIYLSAEDFDNLCKRLEEPSNPVSMKRVEKILKTIPPWERE